MKYAHLLQDRKIVAGGALVFVFLMIVLGLVMGGPKNAGRPDQEFNIPAFGKLPTIQKAMKQNGEIKDIAQRLLSYDEAYIFVNYPQINNDVALLMFLWAGIDQEQLKTLGGKGAIPVFLRYVYDMPEDEILEGNPLLEDNPWGDLLNRYKAIILMQGQGYKIYDGLAYYDNEKDKMVIEGSLSENFVQGFAEFLKTQAVEKRKKYLNNFFLFIRDTKGINNLNSEEKSLIRMLQGIQ